MTTTYTVAILQLIDENPGILDTEIDERLNLQGRKVHQMIRPYIERGKVLVEKVSVEGARNVKMTFSSAGNSRSSAVYARRSENRKWTAEDLEILTSLYPTHTQRAIADRLGRTMQQVRSKSSALKLHKSEETIKKLTGHSAWSTEDIKVLRERYAEETKEALAKLFGKTDAQIKRKATALGLKKSDTFWERTRKKFKQNSEVTQLKAHPIGTEKMLGGYLHIKVGLPSVWVSKARLAWRAHHGDYSTKTHMIWFRDRDRMNFDISNLELITRAEMLVRTTINRYPSELREVIVLHNKLKRRLNEQHRETT